jgi:hypothetical protein
MQKKFLSNLALILVLNLLIKPFAIFGIDATIQNRIGAQEYGLYFSLLTSSLLHLKQTQRRIFNKVLKY